MSSLCIYKFVVTVISYVIEMNKWKFWLSCCIYCAWTVFR